MSKIVWLTGLVAVAVGTGVIYLLLFNGSADTGAVTTATKSEGETTPTADVLEPFSGVGSLASLLNRAADLECSLVFEIEGSGQSEVKEGTLFTSRGRLRSDVLLNAPGQVGVTSVIVRDGKFYSWTDFAGQRNGVEVSINDLPRVSAGGAGIGAVSLADPVSYDCQPWTTVDGSVFEIPRDIIFTTLSTESVPVMEDGTLIESPMGTNDPCEVCRLVPAGPARDECMANFSCQ